MPDYPPLSEVKAHVAAAGAALRAGGVHSKVVDAIRTKALLTAKKVGGAYATNRKPRWQETEDHPQYGTEHDCNIIFVKLSAQIFCFENAPPVPTAIRRVPADIKALGPLLQTILEDRYLGYEIRPNTFKDSLLLERFDFADLVNEGLNPVHGHSSFHIGHEDPTRKPKHVPDNIQWRTFRSNMIQGNMTLPQARLYFVKMIARYFDLGELQLAGEAASEVMADPDPDEISENGTPDTE